MAQQPAINGPLTVDPATTLRAPLAGDPASPSISTLPVVTPEVWVYSDQWRRHDDPAQAVRRKAEARSAQRADRLAAMKWYGFSNARPQAAALPFTSRYAPVWIGNGYHRHDWVGTGFSATAVFVDPYMYQR
jgi:hypothetical protein